MRVLNLLRHYCALGLVLSSVGLASAQPTQIAFWNFNDENTIPDGGANASISSIVLVGGTTAAFASGSPLDAGSPNRAYNTTTYAAQGTESGNRGIQFNVPTTAGNPSQWYTNVRINFDIRWSNTSSRYVQLQYSTDGVNWVNAALLEAPRPNGIGGDIWWSSIQQPGETDTDFRFTYLVPNSVTNGGGFASFAFRMVAVFDPATGNSYTAARAGSNYSPNGTLRYDLVEIKGDLVPEPTSMIALGTGLVSLLALRRRTK